MRNANYYEKEKVVDILTSAFEDNKSVNYLVKQDKRRIRRIQALMRYSFEICFRFGSVFFSNDNKAVALIVYPDKRKTSIKSIRLDVKLAFRCIGITGIGRASKRESVIKKSHPKVPISYLWFIGVSPNDQGKGSGTDLLNELVSYSEAERRVICLETSTERNLSWYKNHGFNIYNKLDFGYPLYFFKRE